MSFPFSTIYWIVHSLAIFLISCFAAATFPWCWIWCWSCIAIVLSAGDVVERGTELNRTEMNRTQRNIISIRFRDKCNKWSNYSPTISTISKILRIWQNLFLLFRWLCRDFIFFPVIYWIWIQFPENKVVML